jgi:metal-responsive CopG/Arc/MetJ family transcriptional regulator
MLIRANLIHSLDKHIWLISLGKMFFGQIWLIEDEDNNKFAAKILKITNNNRRIILRQAKLHKSSIIQTFPRYSIR